MAIDQLEQTHEIIKKLKKNSLPLSFLNKQASTCPFLFSNDQLFDIFQDTDTYRHLQQGEESSAFFLQPSVYRYLP